MRPSASRPARRRAGCLRRPVAPRTVPIRPASRAGTGRSLFGAIPGRAMRSWTRELLRSYEEVDDALRRAGAADGRSEDPVRRARDASGSGRSAPAWRGLLEAMEAYRQALDALDRGARDPGPFGRRGAGRARQGRARPRCEQDEAERREELKRLLMPHDPNDDEGRDRRDPRRHRRRGGGPLRRATSSACTRSTPSARGFRARDPELEPRPSWAA